MNKFYSVELNLPSDKNNLWIKYKVTRLVYYYDIHKYLKSVDNSLMTHWKCCFILQVNNSNELFLMFIIFQNIKIIN